MDPEAFQALLAALDPVREQAGEKYESLRSRLLDFFACRKAARADELADETLDRVSRKLLAGERIWAPDVGRYLLGVARNVLRESWNREQRQLEFGAPARATEIPTPVVEELEAVFGCLERCLQRLPPETRDLMLRYYGTEAANVGTHRRRLADSLGIGVNALRIRMHRLRGRLEACVRACIAGQDETNAPGKAPSSRGDGE